jgi:transcriptional regulator NrdR family protein
VYRQFEDVSEFKSIVEVLGTKALPEENESVL